MKQTTTNERRQYERMPGNGAKVHVTIPDGDGIEAEIKDISRGGMAVYCDATPSSGTDVTVRLPTGTTASGRIVRCQSGLITLAFRQDAVTLAMLDSALTVIQQWAQRAIRLKVG